MALDSDQPKILDYNRFGNQTPNWDANLDKPAAPAGNVRAVLPQATKPIINEAPTENVSAPKVVDYNRFGNRPDWQGAADSMNMNMPSISALSTPKLPQIKMPNVNVQPLVGQQAGILPDVTMPNMNLNRPSIVSNAAAAPVPVVVPRQTGGAYNAAGYRINPEPSELMQFLKDRFSGEGMHWTEQGWVKNQPAPTLSAEQLQALTPQRLIGNMNPNAAAPNPLALASNESVVQPNAKAPADNKTAAKTTKTNKAAPKTTAAVIKPTAGNQPLPTPQAGQSYMADGTAAIDGVVEVIKGTDISYEDFRQGQDRISEYARNKAAKDSALAKNVGDPMTVREAQQVQAMKEATDLTKTDKQEAGAITRESMSQTGQNTRHDFNQQKLSAIELDIKQGLLSDDPVVRAQAAERWKTYQATTPDKYDAKAVKNYDDMGQPTSEDLVIYNTRTGRSPTQEAEANAKKGSSKALGKPAMRGGKPLPNGTKANDNGVMVEAVNGVWQLSK